MLRLSFARLGWLVLAGSLLVGCVSTFSRMMEQGDALAAQGRWDEAASYYESAVALEPGDAEARAKLQQARSGQARQRLAQGQALMAQGKTREALRPLHEATRLDPANAEARDAFEQDKKQVLDRADKDLASGQAREALAAARDVLALVPSDPRAGQLEQAGRQAIAAESVRLGTAHEQRGELAAALVRYAEALVHVEGYPEAVQRFAAAKNAMLERATYHVLVAQFTGDPKADNLGGSVAAVDIARGMPEGYLLQVDEKAPPKKGYDYEGMRLGGAFRDYAYERSTTTTKNGCDYVCGKETIPNPELPKAKASLEAAQTALGSTGRRAHGAQRNAANAAQNREAARGAAEQARLALVAAESTLQQCQSMAPGADCSALQAAVDAAAQTARNANDELSRAEQAADDARRTADEAEQARVQAEVELRDARARLEATPGTVVVDRHCTHEYAADLVSVKAQVEILLRGESLYDTTPVLTEVANGRFGAQDRTFPAVKGKCQELEGGDPLTLPSESDARRAVVASAITDTQAHVIATYEKRRTAYQQQARAAAQAGASVQSTEWWLRYLLTSRRLGSEGAEGVTAISQALGVSEDAVRRAAMR